MSAAINSVEMSHSAMKFASASAQRALSARAAQVFPLTSNYRRR